MARVCELTPGDKVTLADMPIEPNSAVFVAATAHPLWPHLRLVIWRMPNGEWFHDALDARQDVGRIEPSDHDLRKMRLRRALLGDGSVG